MARPRGGWRWSSGGRVAAAALLVATVFSVSATARADAGTPLIWATAFQVVLGNLIIGLFEGLLLVRFFGAESRGRALGWMVLANYVSCGVGLLFLSETPAMSWIWRLAGADRSALLHLPAAAGLALVGSWLLSILAEAPFCALALPAGRRHPARVLRASTALQTASYLVLGLGSLCVSNFGVYRNARVLPETSFAGTDWRVYFQDPSDRRLWSERIDGSGRRRETSAPLAPDVVLSLTTAGSPVWSVVAMDSTPRVLVMTSARHDSEFSWPLRGRPDDSLPFRLVELRHGRRISPYYPVVWGAFKYDGRNLGLETIAGSLTIDRLIELPDERAVIGTGSGEIDVFDPRTNEIGFLTRGRSPVVLPETR